MTRVCPDCGRRFDSDVVECPDDRSPTFLVERELDLIGKDLDGRFEVLELLGTGGMGAVYRAHQHSTDRDIALKLLRPDVAGDENAIKRFFREAKAASRLTSPHTITIFDFGQTRDGLLFIAMELLKGRSLARLLKELNGPMDPDRAAGITAQILDSLDEAHAEGILHRDLKPDNVHLLDVRGGGDFAKILDFGIAKVQGADVTALTATGTAFGTPTYMSPEQAQALELDRRSDLYSVGIILFEMLAGKPPFTADTPLAMAIKKAREKAPTIFHVNPNVLVPAGIERLLERLLSVDIHSRPGDAARVKELLAEAVGSVDGRTVKMPDVVMDERTTKIFPTPRVGAQDNEAEGPATADMESLPPDRSPVGVARWVWIAVAVAGAALLVGGWMTWGSPQTDEDPEPIVPAPVEEKAPTAASQTDVIEVREAPDGGTLVADAPDVPERRNVPRKSTRPGKRKGKRAKESDDEIVEILKGGKGTTRPDGIRLKGGTGK